LLCSLGWPQIQTCNLPTSVSQVLGLQTCTTMHHKFEIFWISYYTPLLMLLNSNMSRVAKNKTELPFTQQKNDLAINQCICQNNRDRKFSLCLEFICSL
jgi:hypothetical protein